MLLSRFNNTCWIHNVNEYCSINSCSMLTKNNSCYNVVGTWADNSWWNKVVDRCQQRLNNGCWTWTTVNNSCWQQLLTGCSTTLLTVCSTTLQQIVDNIDRVVHFCACKDPQPVVQGWWKQPWTMFHCQLILFNVVNNIVHYLVPQVARSNLIHIFSFFKWAWIKYILDKNYVL